MSSRSGISPLMHMLALLKIRYGILVSNCESTTNWAGHLGTVTIATASVTSDPKEDNCKEEGSYVIKATGTADSSGNFIFKYTPSAAINFSGTTAQEFATDWLTYFSLWIKGTKAGTIRITLVDGSSKTAYWDISITSNQQKYWHNALGTYTASDAGFSLSTVSIIRIGYINRSASETSMELRVDGLRVQGDPTFDLFEWSTVPMDQKTAENVISVGYQMSMPGDRAGYSDITGDEVLRLDLDPQPITLTRIPMRIHYQLVSDPSSNRSAGLIRTLRDNLYFEMKRLLNKYGEGLAGENYPYFEYIGHSPNYDTNDIPVRIRGSFVILLQHWQNIHGAI